MQNHLSQKYKKKFKRERGGGGREAGTERGERERQTDIQRQTEKERLYAHLPPPQVCDSVRCSTATGLGSLLWGRRRTSRVWRSRPRRAGSRCAGPPHRACTTSCAPSTIPWLSRNHRHVKLDKWRTTGVVERKENDYRDHRQVKLDKWRTTVVVEGKENDYRFEETI